MRTDKTHEPRQNVTKFKRQRCHEILRRRIQFQTSNVIAASSESGWRTD
jgi:hypothetical protein